MTYRLDYTIRLDGQQHESCQYCEGLANVNKTLRTLEERGAWGFSIHLLYESDQREEDERTYQQEIRLR